MVPVHSGALLQLTWQSNLPGEGVEWMSLSNATAEVGAKPILALIHRAGCGACNSLKGSFTNDASDYERFVRLAKDYTMVSVSDDPAANEDKRLSPDGGYVPRAIFLSADGTPHHEVKNEGYNDKYPHFYISVKQIADSMERTLELEWAKPAEKPCGDPTCEGCDLCKDEL